MFKLLIVEDDKDLNRTVCSYLSKNGYNCVGVTNVEDAYKAMDDNIFDMYISDIMLPDISGYEFAKAVRATDQETPILFITARDDFTSKQLGYGAGIDDYMVKPIDLGELVLRIEALMRRAGIVSSKKLVIGDFEMNMDERVARLSGQDIVLTAREFNILYKFLSYPKKTFTRSQLMDEFWSSDTTSSPRTVDVYVAKIREKLADCKDFEIATVHGLGYKVIINED
jgi:DNA-binding response OmpR family regulator